MDRRDGVWDNRIFYDDALACCTITRTGFPICRDHFGHIAGIDQPQSSVSAGCCPDSDHTVWLLFITYNSDYDSPVYETAFHDGNILIDDLTTNDVTGPLSLTIHQKPRSKCAPTFSKSIAPQKPPKGIALGAINTFPTLLPRYRNTPSSFSTKSHDVFMPLRYILLRGRFAPVALFHRSENKIDASVKITQDVIESTSVSISVHTVGTAVKKKEKWSFIKTMR